jgi:toxin ParE1/3/4
VQLSLTKAAQRDIDAMHAYGVQNFGRSVADDYSKQLLDLLDLLQDNPRMGVERSEFKKVIRTLRYRSHMVFYRLNQRGLKVHRILHTSQNWMQMF